MFSCSVLGRLFNEEALDTKTTKGKRSDRGIGEEGRRKKKRQIKKWVKCGRQNQGIAAKTSTF